MFNQVIYPGFELFCLSIGFKLKLRPRTKTEIKVYTWIRRMVKSAAPSPYSFKPTCVNATTGERGAGTGPGGGRS